MHKHEVWHSNTLHGCPQEQRVKEAIRLSEMEARWQERLRRQQEADRKLQRERDDQWKAELLNFKQEVTLKLKLILTGVVWVVESVWCCDTRLVVLLCSETVSNMNKASLCAPLGD